MNYDSNISSSETKFAKIKQIYHTEMLFGTDPNMEHLLYENVKGYLLFEIKEHENMCKDSYDDYLRLTQAVRLISIYEFANVDDSTNNLKMLCDGKMPPELVNFLNLNEVKILHCDISYKNTLKEYNIDYKNSTNITRGIRRNAHKFMKKDEDLPFILAVSHKFSRSKVEYNIKKEDKLVIHTLNMLEQIEKDINSYTMRVKETYGWCYPELYNMCCDNEEFIKTVNNLLDNNESDVNEKFIKARKNSCGVELQEVDLCNIKNLCSIIQGKIAIRAQLNEYLKDKMEYIAPNLCEFLGVLMVAKLIVLSGGVLNLAKAPASTIQLLGAEKKLFQALKSRDDTPKYGVLYNSSFVNKTLMKNKAKLSRCIASKISILSKIDAFSTKKTTKYGKAIRKLVEKKMLSFDTEMSLESTDMVISRIYKKLNK